MYINHVTSHVIDTYGRVFERTTTYGKVKGYNIAIDNYKLKGKNILEKQFVIWNDKMQRIVSKYRKEKGGFHIVG